MKTLLTARFTDQSLQRLINRAGAVQQAGFGVTGEKLPESEILARVADIDCLVVEFEEITDKVLKQAKTLKIAACCRNEPAASFDIEAATRLGIPVIFPPGRNAVSVAEYTIGLMIAASRHIADAHYRLRHTDEFTAIGYSDKTDVRSSVTSEWSMDPGAPFHRFQGPELYGKTLGLVGCGAIGTEIAKRASAFAMRVLVADPFVSDGMLRAIPAERRDLIDVAGEADFFAMAAKVTSDTEGIVGSEVISQMKPSAYFINTARAALVDYEALFRALDRRRIAGAALDVYPVEPIPSDSPFRTLDNVVLSPHLAGASRDIPVHHSRMIIDDIFLYLDGKRPTRLANPTVWEVRR